MTKDELVRHMQSSEHLIGSADILGFLVRHEGDSIIAALTELHDTWHDEAPHD